MDGCDSISTPMATAILDADLHGTPTYRMKYRSIIGGLMYHTASRPDIAFATFVCARYQARPTVKHLKEVKRILRYLKQTYNMGLWYPKDSGYELIAYSDADHAWCHDDCKKFIMAQQQPQQIVSRELLVPANKRLELAEANKKIDLVNPSCPLSSKILGNILTCHPLRFALTASASVAWIYIQQVWHTLRLDDSKERLDVPTTQLQLIESTQGTHRTPSAPRPPNPVEHHGESSAPRKPTIIRIQRRSQPDLETLIPTAAEIDIAIKEHLVEEEIEKIVERNGDVDANQFFDEILNSQEDPGTRLEPENHKERPEVKKSVDLMIIDEEEKEEPVGDVLIIRKGKGIMEIKDTPQPTPIRSLRTHSASLSSDKEELQELTASNPTPSSSKPTTSSPKPKPDCSKKDFKAIIEAVHATLKKVVPSMVDKTLNYIMKKNLPKIVADRIRSERQKFQNDLVTLVTHDMANTVPSQIKFEKHVPLVKPCRITAVRTRDHEDHHNDNAHPEGESSAKRQKTSEHETYTTGESSSPQAMNESTPFSSGTQEQREDFDAWQDGQGTNDDEVPDEEVSSELLEGVFGKVMTFDEADGEYSEFTESDYKYIHKNDIEDMYLMCINRKIKDYRQTGLLKSLILFIRSCVYWERVHDYQLGMESYQEKVNLIAPTPTFQGIEEEKLLTITSDLIVGLIYESSKQENRVIDIK
ncbi:hypothetical protein Tco_0792385 [Tanacetum coccineum]